MTAFKKYLSFSIVQAIFLICCGTANAQMGLGDIDLTQLRSSDVSDVQLQTLIERAEQEGVTIEQALQLAQQRGLPASVADQLRTRIRELQTGEGVSREEVEGAGEEAYTIAREFLRPPREETEVMKKTFGSEIFRQRMTEFTPTYNIATPVNYTLGAGDELVINIWGDQSFTYRLTVNPEGTIYIEGVGPVFVNGLTIDEANRRIKESLGDIYAGLRGSESEQTTFARVTIDRLRTIQVSVIGDASNPGDYTVPSNATVFNVLYRAGGPAEDGSYRTVRLIRDNEKIAELDLYDFLINGVQSGNVRLRDRDVIQIPPYENRVEVTGEVKRSDLYFETLQGESLYDLIRYAGGFTDRAYRAQVRIHRNTAASRRIVTVDSEEFNRFAVQSGDVVHVDPILDKFENRVMIEGAVWRSGEYELKEGMTLHDLIMEAEGPRPDAFMPRGLINRLGDDFTLEQISFDVLGVLRNPESNDIVLQREDQVLIRSIHEIEDQHTVNVDGAIRKPGEYIHRDKMTLEDLILKADGFTDAASESRIEISRRILGDTTEETGNQRLAEIFSFRVSRNLQLSEGGEVFELKPFDQVFVHQRPDYQVQQKVTIEGEVRYPGTYTIRDKNERISDLIKRAGGLTEEAYEPGARLVRQHTAIDRPQIEFDFLASEEVVDEEQTGLTIDEENEDSRPLEQRQPQQTVREEESDSESARDSLIRARTELNRQDFRPMDQDSLESEEDEARTRTESRIGIDLAAILEDPGSQEDLFLRDGDVLRVPKQLQTVAISGAVMQDVEVRYRSGANMGYYIDRAGGFAANARKKSVYIVYANGDVDRRKNYLFGLIKNSPPIEPGAHIIIPEKTERAGLESGELISISAAIVGMTTSLIIAIDRISR